LQAGFWPGGANILMSEFSAWSGNSHKEESSYLVFAKKEENVLNTFEVILVLLLL
jgi:hypothetical protein